MTRAEECLKEIYDYFVAVENGVVKPMNPVEFQLYVEEIVESYIQQGQDPVVKQVLDKFSERSETGIRKYGTTLEENDGDILYWVNHLQEELMDAILYSQKIKNLLEDGTKN